jgi:uncharacterized ubiquitin-like protein YukD
MKKTFWVEELLKLNPGVYHTIKNVILSVFRTQFLSFIIINKHVQVCNSNCNKYNFSLSTPPGTKIRLKGTVPLVCGFMLLEPRHVEVLGGKVETLILKWETHKVSVIYISKCRIIIVN